MSNFIYKNPIVGSFVTAPNSVQSIEDFYGSNFSVYNIGGYMEVWNLSDLEFTTNGQTGNIRYSGNTIPVLFNKAATSSLADSITLYNDGISSGRRRLGMLVYVHETNTTYQYQIDADNSADSYENMWTAATAVSNLVEYSDEAITVKNRTGFFQPITQAGQDLIDAWTGSTIEGVNGVTRNNAKWRIFWGTDWQVTGGTIDYNSTGDLNLNSNSGNTVTISGLKTITGGTYLSASTTLELYNNLSETIEITGFTSGGGTDISVSANTGLGIIDPNTLYTIYNSTLSGSLEMDEDVGGLTTGTRVDELTGKTFVQLFDDLLFPTVLPTYTIPTITLNGLPSSQTLEVGSSKAIAVNGYGVKNDAGDFTSLRIRTGTTTPNVDVVVDNSPTPSNVTDIPDQFGYTNPNNPNSGFTSTQLAYTLIVPPPLAGQTSSSTKYDAEGDCNAGQAKLDNKGVTDTRTAGTNTNTPQAARTDLNASDRTITGIYPYFWGVSSTQPTVSSIVNEIQNGTANKVLSSAAGSFTITFNASSEFLWFAHFAEYNDKTTWYVDGNNNGTIGTQLFDNPQVSSVDSPETYWTNINFDIYISYYATTTVGGMTFS